MDAVINWNQVAGLREQGLNDDQICAALSITREELDQSAGRELAARKSETQFGPLMEFTQEQVNLARNQIAMEVISGDSSAARLRAASLILQLHAIPAADKYRAAKGLNAVSTVNNIMIAVDNAQKLKQATIAE